MKKTKQESAVISFRVPLDVAFKVDQQAKKEKKKRSQFVEPLFSTAFEEYLATQTLAKQTT